MGIVKIILVYGLIAFIIFMVTKDGGLAFKWPYLFFKSLFTGLANLRGKYLSDK